MQAASDTRSNELTHLWWTVAHMFSDSQQVVAMRLLGLSGVWSVPSGESSVMFSEKAPAFTEALVSGMTSVLNGQAPQQVMLAAIDPICDKARANRARLASRGPRYFGA